MRNFIQNIFIGCHDDSNGDNHRICQNSKKNNHRAGEEFGVVLAPYYVNFWSSQNPTSQTESWTIKRDLWAEKASKNGDKGEIKTGETLSNTTSLTSSSGTTVSTSSSSSTSPNFVKDEKLNDNKFYSFGQQFAASLQKDDCGDTTMGEDSSPFGQSSVSSISKTLSS